MADVAVGQESGNPKPQMGQWDPGKWSQRRTPAAPGEDCFFFVVDTSPEGVSRGDVKKMTVHTPQRGEGMAKSRCKGVGAMNNGAGANCT